jgi:hypothetical protein
LHSRNKRFHLFCLTLSVIKWMTEKQLRFEIHKQEKQIYDLYALIDTLQANLRTATNYLSEEDKEKVVNVQSYKWCMNWKQGDEKEV